jgi:hypothetical protein
MRMHRLQRFDASPLSIRVTDYSRTLRSVLRHAVGYALASALGASGCYSSTDPVLSQPSAATNGGAGQGAPIAQTSPSAPVSPTQPSAAGSAGASQPPPIQRPPHLTPASPTQPSAAGSGGAGQAAPIAQTSRPTPVSVACSNVFPQLFAGLTAQPFDAAEFRVQAESLDYPQIWFGQGALCGAATDPTACQSQVTVVTQRANLLFADYLPMFGMTARYVLTTLGNEVHKYQSREELLQFLGPIDSPQDALLLLYYDHRGVLCEPVDRTQSFSGVDPATIVELDDGYQALFLTQMTGCTGTQTERVTLHIARNGAVTETAKETMLPPMTGCP